MNVKAAGKWWRTLGSFSAKEHRTFAKFLASPYFNTRQDLQVLYKQASERLSEEQEPEGETLWRAVHPDRPFDRPAMRHLQSYLLKQMEAFLVHQWAASDLARHRMDLAEAYNSKGLGGLEASALHHAAKALDKNQQKDDAHFQRVLRYHELQYNAVSQQQRSVREQLLDWSGALDDFFVLMKLRQACTMVAQQGVFKTEMRLGFLEAVLEAVEAGDFGKEPAIGIYFHAYKMLTSEAGESHYSHLVNEMQSHGDLFPEAEARAIYLMAINFCIRSLNRGLPSYGAQVYELYMKGLADGWLLENGRLSPWTYKNVVSAGLKLRRFDSVEDFIEGYRTALPPNFQYDYHRYCLAELQLARGDFQQVLRTLRFVQIKDRLAHLRARILQIKAAYELGEFSMVEYQLDNLRQLLRRKKDLAYHKGHYVDFERLARKLVSLGPNAEQRAKLENEIAGFQGMAEMDWLLEKCRGEA